MNILTTAVLLFLFALPFSISGQISIYWMLIVLTIKEVSVFVLRLRAAKFSVFGLCELPTIVMLIMLISQFYLFSQTEIRFGPQYFAVFLTSIVVGCYFLLKAGRAIKNFNTA